MKYMYTILSTEFAFALEFILCCGGTCKYIFLIQSSQDVPEISLNFLDTLQKVTENGIKEKYFKAGKQPRVAVNQDSN